jgi:hypothetical protein
MHGCRKRTEGGVVNEQNRFLVLKLEFHSFEKALKGKAGLKKRS